MIITINWDDSVDTNPDETAFKGAIQYVANAFDNLFTDNVTITIDIGWGEVGNGVGPGFKTVDDGGATSLFELLGGGNVTYANVVAANPDVTYATEDQVAGRTLFETQAQLKALGVSFTPTGHSDGWVGFDASADWNYSTDDRGVGSKIDIVGAAAHEFTEVMGRVILHDPSRYDLLTLLRWSGDGVPEPVGANPAYASIDGGQTLLANFNTDPGGDFGDWAVGTGNDAFDASIPALGAPLEITTADLAVMSGLGWHVLNDGMLPTISMDPIAGTGTLKASIFGDSFIISGTTTGVETDQIVTVVITDTSNNEVATYQGLVEGNGAFSIDVDGDTALSQWLHAGTFHLSAEVQNQEALLASATEDMTFVPTGYSVMSEAELNAAIATINQGGGNNLTDTSYTIFIDGDFAIDNNVTSIDLGVSSGVVFKGAGILSGSGGLSVTSGGLNLESAHTAFTGDVTINDSGTLVAAGNLQGNIVFSATGNGTLIDDAGNFLTNTIKGFAVGDTIEITNDNAVGGISLAQGNVLNTYDFGRHVGVHLQLDPNQNFSGKAFDDPTFVNDGHDLVIQMHDAIVNYTINNEADWNAAVTKIDISGSESAINTYYTFTLSSSFTLSSDMDAINLADGSSLTINGSNAVIDGANAHRAIFDYNGAVTVNDLTIKNTLALGGAGGTGDGGGGGGLGAGGAVYVASGGDITLSNVLIESNKAQGGAGGLGTAGNGVPGGDGGGAGGGLGGTGGSNGGGGGGIGFNAIGAQGTPGLLGNAGIILGASNAQTNGGAFGGGGGPGEGGGIETAFSDLAEQLGGYGGGGGASGQGGFGGGGGGGALGHSGGLGGYGAGGGGGAGNSGNGAGSTFGGGDGGDGGETIIDANDFTLLGGGGGGGAGLGGGIFVEAGGSLSISGGSELSGNSVAGGSGGSGTSLVTGDSPEGTPFAGASGSASGQGIFMAGSGAIHFTAGANQTITIADNISDEAGTTGGSTGQVFIDGPGTVVLSATNTFGGGISLQNGTLDLAADGAAGSGPVTFAAGHTATLAIDTQFTTQSPSAIANDWFVGQTSTIDLLNTGTVTSAIIGGGNVVTVTGGGHSPMTLNLNPGEDFSGIHFVISTDGHGGSDLNLAVNNTASNETELNDILRIIDVGGHAAQTNTDYTITLTSNFSFDDNLYAINLPTGDTLTIDGAGHTVSGDAGGGQFYRGFFDYGGTLTLKDLTLSSFQTHGGIGGNGQGAGGGGAGLGGALYIGADGRVTLDNVNFTGNHAFGGDGGGAEGAFTGGGGGGLGGDGGTEGGGGGIGGGDSLSAHGGQLVSSGSGPTDGIGIDGIVLGAASGASTTNSDGGKYGGGGGGEFDTSGAGGGIGASGVTGGYGGGGGGAVDENAGDGGFGGGGGGVHDSGFTGGDGGFGGGGGGGDNTSTGGAGGFGAGAGHAGNFVDDHDQGPVSIGGGGGGGLGAGGAIFLQEGGTLTYQTSGTESTSQVAGGLGGDAGFITSLGQFIDTSGNGGFGYGSALFIQGDNDVTFAPDAGKTLTLDGTIADEFGNGGTGGKGSITMNGAGTLVLDGHLSDDFGNTSVSSFAGGVNFNSGTLELGADATGLFFNGAATLNAGAGTGDIRFGTGDLTLVIDGTVAPVGTIDGFGVGDTIDMAGLASIPDLQFIGTQNGTIFNDIFLNQSGTQIIHLDATVDMTALTFNHASDGQGGTKIFFSNGAPPDTTPPTVTVSDSKSGHLLAGDTDTITFTFSETVSNFDNGDVAVTGGTLGTITQTDATHYTATFTPNVTDTLSASVAVLASGTSPSSWTDITGNAGTASNTFTITGDTKAPTVTEGLKTDSGAPGDGITNIAVLTGTADRGAPVHLAIDGNAPLSLTVNSSTGAWSFTPSGLSQGAHTVVASESDTAGNVGSHSLTFTLDTVVPTITAASTTSTGAIPAGQQVVIDLTTSEAVAVTGSPTLVLSDKGIATYDAANSDPATGKLEFDYVAQTGQNTGNATLMVTLLTLAKGVTITDLAGNALNVTGAAKADLGVIVDTIAPAVTKTAATTGAFHQGDTVGISLVMSEAPVDHFVNTAAFLTLSDGGTATYASTSGNTLLFNYVVAAGENTTALKVTGFDTSGETFTDAAGNTANLTKALTTLTGVGIDTTAPTVAKVAGTPSTGSVNTGVPVTITLTMSEKVTVTGHPVLTLDDGGTAAYVSGSGTTALVFKYTPAGLENSADLHLTGVDLSSGATITDTAGNNADLGGATADLKVAVVTTPVISSVTSTPAAGGSLPVGGEVVIDLTTNEAVTVVGAPMLTLSNGAVAHYDSIKSDPANDKLEFDYTVGAKDKSGDLKITAVTLPSGTTIKDASSHAIVTTGGLVDLHVTVDTVAPIVTEKLQTDTGVSTTDKLTNTATLSGSGDANATVHFNVDGSGIVPTATADGKGLWTILGTDLSLGDGQHTIIASETDAAGNVGHASITFTVDATGPTITGTTLTGTAATQGGYIGTGETLTFFLNLSDANTLVAPTGTSSIFLSDGLTATFNSKASDLAHGKAAYSVVITAGHDQGALTIDGSQNILFKDAAGNAVSNIGDLGSTVTTIGTGVIADTVAPTVSSVTTPGLPFDGSVPAGQLVEIDVNTSEDVVVTGTGLTLQLNDKGTATYVMADSTATKLVFHYTPAAGQNTADLQTTALVLAKGTTVTDAAGNALNLTTAAKQDLHLIVDSNAPTVSAITKTTTPSGATALASGNVVHIAVTMTDATGASDVLNVSGTPGDTPVDTPALTLNDGGEAVYMGRTGNVLNFDYTVQNESTTDLKVTRFDFTNGSITDGAGNLAVMPSNLASADLKLPVNVFNWTGASHDGLFDTSGNWNPSTNFPQAGNTANIALAGTYTVTSTGGDSVGNLNITDKTATLEMQSNTFAVNDGNFASIGSSSNAGMIQVDAGATLELYNTNLANSGKIELNNANFDTVLEIIDQVTLSGKGQVILSTSPTGGGIIEDAVTGDLINVDNTISGTGLIGNDTFLTVDNKAAGVIKATAGPAGLTLNSRLAMTNEGTLEAAANSNLIINNDISSNSGTIEAAGDGASVVISGAAVTNTATGVIEAINSITASSVVELDGATITNGTLKTSGAGAHAGFIHVASDSTFNGVTNTGALTVSGTSDVTLTVNGPVFNNTKGVITLDGNSHAAEVYIGNDMTLQGAGSIVMKGGGAEIGAGNPLTVLTNADNTISGHGTIGDADLAFTNGAKGVVSGDGLIIDATAHTAINQGTLKGVTSDGLTISGTVNNSNLIEALGNNALVTLKGEVDNLVVGKTAGSIVSSGTGALVTFENGAEMDGGKLTVMAGAGVEFKNASLLSQTNNPITVSNAGTMTLDVGDHLDIIGTVTLTGKGQFHLSANSIIDSNGSAAEFINQGNTISGDGAFDDAALTVDNQSGIISATLADGIATNEAMLEGNLFNESVTQKGAGQILAAANSLVDIDGGGGATDVTNGKLVGAAGTSTIEISNSVTLTNVTVSNAGELDIFDGNNIKSTGTFANTGYVSIDNASVEIDGAVTNNGTGTVEIAKGANGLIAIADSSDVVFAGPVSGTGEVAIALTSTVEFKNASTTQNVGFLDDSGNTLVLDHSQSFKGTISGLAGPAGSFSNFFTFGDSTVDSGWFPTALANTITADETGSTLKNELIQNAVAHGGTGTPVGLGLMNSQILANDLGFTSFLPSDTPGLANGSAINYAIAGATNAADAANTNTGNLNNNSTLPSTIEQIQNYLALPANGGHADANALFLVSSGGNDITYAKDTFTTGTDAQILINQENYLDNQIHALVAEIQDLQAKGAQHILVLNNYGNGTLNNYYSTNLFSALDSAGVNYIQGDIQSVVNYIKANPTLYGFTAQTVLPGDGGNTSSAFVLQTQANSGTLTTPGHLNSGWGQWGAKTTTASDQYAYLRAPNAQYTSLYSDNEHLSTIGQAIEATYELSLLFAAGLLQVDRIDLKDIPYLSPGLGDSTQTTAIFSGTASGGTVTVSDGAGHTAKLTLTGDYRDVTFGTASDGHGGTLVFDPPGSSTVAAELSHNPLSSGHYDKAITAGTDLGMIDFSVSKNVTLSGDGTITLSSDESIVSHGHAVTLTNHETIAGGGVIGDEFMKLVNGLDGVIDANSTDNGMLISTPEHAVNNVGVIEATNGGWLVIDHTKIANEASGVVQALDSGSHIDLDGATITGGSVSIGAGATVDTINGDASTISHSVVSNAGTLAATYGDLTVKGTVHNTGVLSASNASHLDVTGNVTGAGTATIENGGVLEFGAASSARVSFAAEAISGSLILDTSTNTLNKFTGTISGFAHGDDIDLGGVDYSNGNSQLSLNGNVLTVSDGVHQTSLSFDAHVILADLEIRQDAYHHVDLFHV